jgi:hypothetical protein
MNFTFDWNEWFFIVTTIIFLSLFLLIRKYFPPIIVNIIWVINIGLVSTIDYFLLATPFKLYIYPLFAILLIILFHFIKKKLLELSLPE